MSPLAEKLNAILDDRDKLSAQLTEWRKHCAAQDETITALQQQTSKQASEMWTMRNQIGVLQSQLAEALLLATDPDDAKLKTRIDAMYNEVVPAAASQATSSTSSSSSRSSSSQASSAALGTGEVSVSVAPARSSGGNGARAASPSSARPAAAAQASRFAE